MEKDNLILELNNIVKRFGVVEVLHSVDFRLKRGEIHAILGQNGAGKSTLVKIINGIYPKDGGEIKVNGNVLKYNSPKEASKHGISMVFQEFSLIPTLTVAQNIFLTKEPRIGKLYLNDSQMEKQTVKIFKSLIVDFQISPEDIVEKISIGSQQIVEIAKAISKEAKILILDEPTASLSSKEINSLFKIIKQLKNKGISIIYISHYLEEVFRLCDSVTVLRDGKVTFNSKIKDTSIDEVVDRMVGEKVKESLIRDKIIPERNGEPLLKVRNINDNNLLKNISFDLWPGEILGIAGLLGSGRSELLNAIFGIRKTVNGKIYLNGKELKIKHPKDSYRHGIAMVPEDRRVKGLIMDFSIKDNLLLPIINKIKKIFYIDDRKGDVIAKDCSKNLNIRSTGIKQIVKYLSGGNQQKVVVGKNLISNSKILLLDDPTYGIDIKSKQEIMDIVNNFANEGNGVIFISSELSEIENYCDRVIILKKGTILEIIESEKEKVSEEKLLKLVQ